MTVSNLSTELQIEIDDVYACAGTCAGCQLSFNEKNSSQPDMKTNILHASISRLKDYINQQTGLERVNLTFGIGDHLRMDDEHLENIYTQGAHLLQDTGFINSNSGIFITFSLVGNSEKIMHRLKKLHRLQSNIPIVPIAVLDPLTMHKGGFGKKYTHLFQQARQLFNAVDLTINLSTPTIRSMTAQQAYQFAVDNGFTELTINWTPTEKNFIQTCDDIEATQNWLIDFDHCIEQDQRLSCSYRPVLKKTIDAVKCREQDTLSFRELVTNHIDGLARRSLQIDESGHFFIKFEAIGDISQSPRFGYQALGNVQHDPIEATINKKIKQISARIIKAHTQSTSCMNCDYLHYCGLTGFHVYLDFLKSRRLSENADFLQNKAKFGETAQFTNVTEHFEPDFNTALEEKCVLGQPPKNEQCPHVAAALFKHYEH
ncbi:MAG: hypothetical protein HN826_15745 [Methylococcales bacterium]|jgi:radical SAM protein with 4Fe4S-binding SPASM domain|nr:hypothetical protein [Methylococcales bacterium]